METKVRRFVAALTEEYLSRHMPQKITGIEPRELGDIKRQFRETILDDSYTKHRYKLISSVEEYISNNEMDYEYLDGFVTFRLKYFKAGFDDLFTDVVDDYIIERQYKEFARLLKYFVETQEETEPVTIVFTEDSYDIFNDEGVSIKEEYDAVMPEERENVADEDVLMTALVTKSPKRVTLIDSHCYQNKDIIDTIKDVFSDRLVVS